jgi:tetratricopeptide (TPR) repeat protein
MRSKTPGMGILLTLFSSLAFFLPHGDLHLRIEEISRTIEQHPDSLELYRSRGELYLQHEEPALAHEDFTFCLQRGLEDSRVLEGMSKSMVPVDQLDSSMYYINLALDKDPANASSMEWKARLLYLLNQFCESGQLYETIIADATSPSPSLFIDASNSWMHCRQPVGYQHAIDILKTGIERIGPLHVLQKELVQHYLQHQDFKSALSFQTELIDHAVNKTIPLYERAMIYQAAGQNQEALVDIQAALLRFEQLPESKRDLLAMIQLKQKMEALLNQLRD